MILNFDLYNLLYENKTIEKVEIVLKTNCVFSTEII